MIKRTVSRISSNRAALGSEQNPSRLYTFSNSVSCFVSQICLAYLISNPLLAPRRTRIPCNEAKGQARPSERHGARPRSSRSPRKRAPTAVAAPRDARWRVPPRASGVHLLARSLFHTRPLRASPPSARGRRDSAAAAAATRERWEECACERVLGAIWAEQPIEHPIDDARYLGVPVRCFLSSSRALSVRPACSSRYTEHSSA